MPPAVSEPTTPASERPQTYALDHATTGIGHAKTYVNTLITVLYLQLVKFITIIFLVAKPIMFTLAMNSTDLPMVNIFIAVKIANTSVVTMVSFAATSTFVVQITNFPCQVVQVTV
jgi:hypothetical protein